jgi:hypothetical protein
MLFYSFISVNNQVYLLVSYYISSSVSDEGASVTIYALRENLLEIAKIIKFPVTLVLSCVC